MTRLVSGIDGLFGTQVFGGTVVQVKAGDRVSPVASGLLRPVGIAAYPPNVPPGVNVAIVIRIDSPVNAMVTAAAGRRIGVDASGAIVNDFGELGYVGEPGEPRILAIREPAAGSYAIEAVGTGDGPYGVHIYSVDTTRDEGSHIVTRGTATPGATSEHDFTLAEDGAIAFIPRSNLIVAGIAAPGKAVAGTPITVKDTTRNVGSGETAASSTRLWLSTNKVLGGDVDLGSRNVPALLPSGQNVESRIVDLPLVPPGTYYLLVEADSAGVEAEANEADNVRVKSLLIGPDLVLKAVTLSPPVPTSGAPTDVTLMVANAGAANTGPSVSRLYRSSDRKFDGTDVLLAELPLASLDGGATASQSVSLGLPAGTYYLLAICDGAKAIAEAKETNNVKSVPVTIP